MPAGRMPIAGGGRVGGGGRNAFAVKPTLQAGSVRVRAEARRVESLSGG